MSERGRWLVEEVWLPTAELADGSYSRERGLKGDGSCGGYVPGYGWVVDGPWLTARTDRRGEGR